MLQWMMNGYDLHARPHPQQSVVATTVGGRLKGEFQCLGHLQERRPCGRGGSVQEVHDVGTGEDLLIKRSRAGRAHGLKAVKGDIERMSTNWRSPSACLAKRSRRRVIDAGRFQSLNGAPLRSAPGLRSRAAT